MSAQLTPPGGNSRVLAQTEGTRWNPANALVEGTEPRVWGSQGHQNPEDRVAEMSELPGETVAGRPLPECPAGHRAHSIEMLTDHRALSNTQVYSVPALSPHGLPVPLASRPNLAAAPDETHPPGDPHVPSSKPAP